MPGGVYLFGGTSCLSDETTGSLIAKSKKTAVVRMYILIFANSLDPTCSLDKPIYV